jgi:hypothetical protein
MADHEIARDTGLTVPMMEAVAEPFEGVGVWRTVERMALFFGYPAIVSGLVAGYLGARRGWPLGLLLTVGAATFGATGG